MASPITRISDRTSGRNVLLYDADGQPVSFINGQLPTASFLTDPKDTTRQNDFDVAHNSIVVSQLEHSEIHEGQSFSYRDVITLGAAASQDYLITVPDTALWPHFGYELEGQGEVDLSFFEGTDKAGSVLQTTVFNRNRNSATLPTTTVHKGSTGGTIDGTLLLSRASGSSSGAGKFGAQVGEGQERVLKQNTKYIFRITSQAASNKISVRLSWYENADASTGIPGVIWPMNMPMLASDPTPSSGAILFYALTDGNASPNNVISTNLMMPDGRKVVLSEVTI